MAREKKQLFEKRLVPEYMTSFADMMTIVLTFFILLYSYSTEIQVGVVSERVEAFKQNINNFGLPSMFSGAKKPVKIEKEQPQFYSAPQESKKPKEDRQLQAQLPFVKGITSLKKLPYKRYVNITIPITFEKSKYKLTEKHVNYLAPLLPLLADKKGAIKIISYSGWEHIAPKPSLHFAFRRAWELMKFLHLQGKISFARLQPVVHAGNSSKHRLLELTFESF